MIKFKYINLIRILNSSKTYLLSEKRTLRRLYKLMLSFDKYQIRTLFFISLFASVCALSDLFYLYSASNLIESLTNIDNITNTKTLCLTLIIASLVSTVLRIITLHLSTFGASKISSRIAHKLYASYLLSSFKNIRTSDSNESITLLTRNMDRIFGDFLVPLANISANLILAIAIISYILSSAFYLSILIIIPIIVVYFVYGYFSRTKMLSNGNIILLKTARINSLISVSINNIIRIFNSSRFDDTLSRHYKYDTEIRNRDSTNISLRFYPRFLLEGTSVITITLIIFFSLSSSSISNNFVNFTIVLIGLQKLLPTMQLVFGPWTQIVSSIPVAERIFKLYADCNSNKELNLFPKVHNYPISKKDLKYKIDRTINIKSLEFIFTIRNISKRFLTYSNAGLLTITGTSGLGKTLLLDSLAGFNSKLSYLSSSKFMINGKVLSSSPIVRSEYFSYKEQDPSFIESSTLDLIDFERSLNPKNINILRFNDLIEEFNLNKYFSKNILISKMSGGERQRLALSLALSSEKPIILLDEPTNGLDQNFVSKLISILNYTAKYHLIIMISHDPRVITSCEDVLKF